MVRCQSNPTIIASAKSLEIVQLLAEDSNVFEYRNFGEFNFEIQLRNRVIAAAIALDKSNVEFSTLEESESNKQYWRLSKDGTFTLQPGFSLMLQSLTFS